MNSEIETKGFIIGCPGDPSVGIMSSRWEITGGFYFDSKESLEEFREDLKSIWAVNISDENIYVETFEEIEEREAKYLAEMDPEDYANDQEKKVGEFIADNYEENGDPKEL
jgi:hypothetical protein